MMNQPFKIRIEELKNEFSTIFNELEKCTNKTVKLLAYFSLMECIAQDIANYPTRENRKIFKDFVLKYQNVCTYLNELDPVTLFYRTEHIIKKTIFVESFSMLSPDNEIIREAAENVKNALLQQTDPKTFKRYCEEHTYINLLYTMRCRLSHEFSTSCIAIAQTIKTPHYIQSSFFDQGKLESRWALQIPVDFVKAICENCITNYLNECEEKEQIPLPNRMKTPYIKYSWFSYPIK